jgi:hypothetical protein
LLTFDFVGVTGMFVVTAGRLNEHHCRKLVGR